MAIARFGLAFRVPPRKRFPVPLLHPRRWRALRPAWGAIAAAAFVALLVLEALRHRHGGGAPFFVERP